MKYPAETIVLFDQIVNQIYQTEYQSDDENYIQVKVTNLMKSKNMRQLNPKDINTLISINGIFIRCGQIYPEIKGAYFECEACQNEEYVNLDRGKV